VNDIEGAAKIMHQLFLEMKRRQETIRKFTNDISKYNQMVAAPDRLPHILIVFDEYPAIWVKRELAKSIDEFAAQIAIQGRASGIHLFIGGQQAYSGDINRLIVANITHRYTSRQNTVGASMSTTGDRSAQKLRPVAGRFLCTTDSDNSYVVQMPMIEDHEITEAVAASQQWEKARPVILPALPEDDEEYLDDSKPLTPGKSYRELIIEGAIELLDGHLKGQKLYELLGGKVPQKKLFETIKQIVEEPIEYKGLTYTAIRIPGGAYRLELEVAAAAD
jgi:DNA segregation ATPase FtsK/SpoIIIE-like protein